MSSDNSENKIYSGSDQNDNKIPTNQHADLDTQIAQKKERGALDEQQSGRLRRAEDARNTRKENIERLRSIQKKGPVWTSTK